MIYDRFIAVNRVRDEIIATRSAIVRIFPFWVQPSPTAADSRLLLGLIRVGRRAAAAKRVRPEATRGIVLVRRVPDPRRVRRCGFESLVIWHRAGAAPVHVKMEAHNVECA